MADTDATKLLNYYFAQYQGHIVRLLKRPKRARVVAGYTDTLNGQNVNQLLAGARADLAAHAALKNNPHAEDIRSIGSFSDAYLRAEAVKKIPSGILPISTYGIADELTDAQVQAAWSGAGWILTCSRTMNVIVSGTPFVLAPVSIDLRTIDAAPANKTFHVFVHLRFGVAAYRARTDSPPEGNAIMYIGTITTNAAGIASVSFKTVLRIDTFRLSQTPVGSAIPVQGGTYDAPVAFPATWNPA
jgi:hypothetical protein